MNQQFASYIEDEEEDLAIAIISPVKVAKNESYQFREINFFNSDILKPMPRQASIISIGQSFKLNKMCSIFGGDALRGFN